MNITTIFTVIAFIFTGGLILYFIINSVMKSPKNKILSITEAYKVFLKNKVKYYSKLNESERSEFEKRLLKFLSHKNITGIDTNVSNEDRLLVASSAIIPLFGFPYYSYPGVKEILLYPNSFDKKFQTNNEVEGRNILGMVGDGFLKGHVLLFKPDLEAAFDGTRHKNNVGIHEFIHLIDGADGVINGIPDVLFEHSFTLTWLKEIAKEMNKIKYGHSDINPYALTNNAEFLAVVGEYFFDNPETMKTRHPELYNDLVKIFHQNPANADPLN
ncbi:MAG: zinc-dependent peptidase [Bacteroidales bacterium]|nr:zinc-dependent peptidase [Bacteroidales bacterium]